MGGSASLSTLSRFPTQFYHNHLTFVSFLARYQQSLSYSATRYATDGFLCRIATLNGKVTQR